MRTFKATNDRLLIGGAVVRATLAALALGTPRVVHRGLHIFTPAAREAWVGSLGPRGPERRPELLSA